MVKRFQTSEKRARRVGVLAKAHSAASQLYNTGVRPQQTYDAPVIGLGPTQMQKLRSTARLCVKKAGCRPCVATLLHIRLGPGKDPAIREPVEYIKLWMQVYERYRTVECKRQQLKLAWTRALPKVVHKGANWRNVGGPLTATIATIAEQGWKPIAPGHWRTPDETMEAVLNGEKSDNPPSSIRA